MDLSLAFDPANDDLLIATLSIWISNYLTNKKKKEDKSE